MSVQLESRLLGKTGLTVTRFGAGGHFTNGPLAHKDVPRRVRELHHLLDLGVTYIDVQWGLEEAATAELLKSRGDAFTVAWPLHGMNKQDPAKAKPYVVDYCNDHRRQFGIEHVDILLWVGLAFEDGLAVERVRGAVEGFQALKAEGFCDHFAFSCHHSPQMALRAITEFDDFEVMMVPYCALHPGAGRDLFQAARDRGVGTVAMKPFGGGGGFLNMVWTGEVSHPAVAHLQGDSRPYGAALRWVLKDPHVDCTVPAAHSIQQIDELYEAVVSTGGDDDALLASLCRAMNETGVSVPLRGGVSATADAWD